MTDSKKNKQIEQEISSNNSETSAFANITPRRGSLPADYSRPSPRTPRFPLHSPITPNSPNPTNPLTFSPQLENFEEVNEVLDNLLSKGASSSDNLANKLLGRKEQEINDLLKNIQRLELEKEQWLTKEEELKQNQNRQSHLLNKQNQRLEAFERELKESNDDFYQISEKNQGLNQLLSQERLEHKKTEQRLNQEADENYRLKENQEKINQNLLAKVNELTNLKRLNQQEREQ